MICLIMNFLYQQRPKLHQSLSQWHGWPRCHFGEVPPLTSPEGLNPRWARSRYQFFNYHAFFSAKSFPDPIKVSINGTSKDHVYDSSCGLVAFILFIGSSDGTGSPKPSLLLPARGWSRAGNRHPNWMSLVSCCHHTTIDHTQGFLSITHSISKSSFWQY